MIISKKKIIASAMALSMMAGTMGSIGGQAIVGSAATAPSIATSYTGSTRKTQSGLSAVYPGDVTNFKQYKSGVSSITLQWNKVNNADGYFIKIYNPSTKSWKTTTINSKNTTKYTYNKLKANTAYKFVIRSYKKRNGTVPKESQTQYISKKGAQIIGMTGFKSAKATFARTKLKTSVYITIPKANENVSPISSYEIKITPIDAKGKLVTKKAVTQNIKKGSMNVSGKNLKKTIDVSKYEISKYKKVQITITPVINFNLAASSMRNASKGTVNGGTYTIKNVSIINWHVLDEYALGK